MTLKSFMKVNISVITDFTVTLKDGSHQTFIVNYLDEDHEKFSKALARRSYWEKRKTKIKYVDVINGKMCVMLEEA